MVFKRILFLAVFGALFLVACAGRAAPAASSPSPSANQAQAPVFAAGQPTPTHTPGCTVQTRKPNPNPTVESLLPPVTDQDWTIGPADAMVTILEYSDFQCPGCVGLEKTLAQLQKKYPQDVRIAYRHYPLFDKSQLAARAAEAAGMQGKFWEMHDLLFSKQSEWVDLNEEQFQEWISKQTGSLGLDAAQFEKDLNSEALINKVKEAYERNAAIGMPGTPFLVINGTPYNGPVDQANLDATASLMLLEKRQFAECPPMTIDPAKQYFATLHTEKGDITFELYADKAPLAVNSFIFLAKHGWFDGVTFHRVIPNFVAQAGDPTGTGFGGPGYAFDNEINPNLKFDKPGVVAMANAGPGSNGSQFFITYTAVPRLDGGYTIFGRVAAGMDVVSKLTPRDPSQSMDLPPGDKILSVEIIEK